MADNNKAPYFDDFDQTKNFNEILFVPGRAPQARELTQAQTLVQDQLGSIAKILVKHGDVIKPGALTFTLSADYVRLASLDTDSEATDYIGQRFIGQTTGVRAEVLHAVAGTGDSTEDAVLYVKYLQAGDKVVLGRSNGTDTLVPGDTLTGSTGGAIIEVVSATSDFVVGRFTNDFDFTIGESVTGDAEFEITSVVDYSLSNTFLAGETIVTYEIVDDVVTETDTFSHTVPTANSNIDGADTTPVGKGSLATIQDGTYFVNDRVTRVFSQTIPISRFSATPSAIVGLEVSEEIVTSDDDDTLLDVAQGYSNSRSPGADRLKITLTLATQSLDATISSDFIPLLRLRDGRVEKRTIFRTKEPTLYATLAERTFDESGNYTVRPFNIDVREHDVARKDPNGLPGIFTTNADATKLAIGIHSGKAYVKGYPVEVPEVQYIETERARDTEVAADRRIELDPGGYVLVAGTYLLPLINSGNDTAEAFPIVDLWNADVPVLPSNGQAVDGVSGYDVTLPLNYPKFTDELFTNGTLILTATNGDKEAHEITDYVAGDSNTNSVITVSSGFSIDTSNATFEIVGPGPDNFDPSIAEIDRYNSEVVGTARIRDIVLDRGTPGLTGVYRVYLFDILLKRGKTFDQAKSMVIRTDTLGGAPIVRNYPRKFRANILSELSVKNFSGIPFTKIAARSAVPNSRNPFTRLRSIKANGTTDLMYAYVHDWDERSKKMLVQNIAGLLVETDRFDNSLDSGDIIEEIDQTGLRTGATADVVSVTKIFDSKKTSLLFRLPYDYVKNVTGVALYGIKRTFTSRSLSPTFTLTDSGETFSTLPGSVTSDNVIVGLTGANGSVGLVTPSSVYMNLVDDYNLSFSVDSNVFPGTSNIQVNVTIDKISPVLKTKRISGLVTDYFMTRSAAQQRILNLKQCDVIEIDSILMSTANSFGDPSTDFDATTAVDITANYVLDDGQRDTFYDRGRVLLKQGVVEPIAPVAVTYRYFVHSEGDYFSVNSYPLSQIEYGEIPKYTSPVTGETYRLSDVIDLRPRKDQYGNFNATRGASGFDLPTVNSWATFQNVEYYLPRIDKLYVDENGDFGVQQGTPSLKPVAPKDPENAMVLYNLYMTPYTAQTTDVKSTYVDNRRYTMRDIGALDRRIEKLEYYTTLSLLEKQTADLKVLDENGQDRYKNGFIVDSFTDHTVGDVDNPDYRCAIDPTLGELRPEFIKHDIDLSLSDVSSSEFVVSSGGIVTLPFTEVAVSSNPYATRTVQVNPFPLHQYLGSCTLTPWADTGHAEDVAPIITANENAGNESFDVLTDRRDFYGTIYDSWRIYGDGIDIVEERSRTRELGANDRQQSARTSNDLTQPNNRASASDTLRTIEGNRVVNHSIRFPMRTRDIRFSASGLAPNTRHYPFFGGQDVSAFCWSSTEDPTSRRFVEIDFTGKRFAPLNSVPSADFFTVGQRLTYYDASLNEVASGTIIAYNEGTRRVRLDRVTGTFVSSVGYVKLSTSSTAVYQPMGIVYNVRGGGEPLYSDDNGNLTGLFRYRYRHAGEGASGSATDLSDLAPFFSGEIPFKLTASSTNAGAPGSSAEAIYCAWTQPYARQNRITTTRSITGAIDRPANDYINPAVEGYWVHPLAQTFVLSPETGCFVTSVDLFFAATELTGAIFVTGGPGDLPVIVEIRTTENGRISNEIVPLSSCKKLLSEISTSGATKFTFGGPLFLQSGVEYALCVRCESPYVTLYTARQGEADLTLGVSVGYQYPGTLYKPQNTSNGVTASTDEDLKFTLYRASFDTSRVAVCNFDNEPLATADLEGFSMYTTEGSNLVRINYPNHGIQSSVGYVGISGLTGEFNGIPADEFNTTFTGITDLTHDYFYISTSTSATSTGLALFSNTDPSVVMTIDANAQADEVCLRAATLTFPGTQILWSMTTFGNATPVSLENGTNVPMSTTRYIGSAAVETAQGASSATVVARLSSSNEYLSPVIDTGRIGLITIGNRISNRLPSTGTDGNIHRQTILTSTESQYLSFNGNTSLSLPAGSGPSFTQSITLDLSAVTEALVLTDEALRADWFKPGATVRSTSSAEFASGTVVSWNEADLVLENVIGTFDNVTTFEQVAETELDAKSVRVNSSVLVTEGTVTLTFLPETIISDYVSVGDKIDVTSYGTIPNKLVGAVVYDVTSTTVVLKYGSNIPVIHEATSVQSGRTNFWNRTQENYISSTNETTRVLLKLLQPNTYVVITGDPDYVPAENMSSGEGDPFRVIDVDITETETKVILDAYLTDFEVSNTTSNVYAYTLDNIVSDLSARGSQAECAYITKQVTLETPADAIQTILTALVPTSTSIDVFYKIQPISSGEDFQKDIAWTAFGSTETDRETSIPTSGTEIVPAPTFKEYTFKASKLSPFLSFAIKICLRSTQTNRVPRVRDFRAIATSSPTSE